MENCSLPNSGTVSHIQLKLGTVIDHSIVASRGMTLKSKGQTSRSLRHVTYSDKNCNNSVLCGPTKCILGEQHRDDLPTSGHKMVAMATTVA